MVAGGSTSFVLDTSGNLWAWGSNNGGQFRQPSSKCASTPTKVDTGVDIVSATASDVVDTTADRDRVVLTTDGLSDSVGEPSS